MHRSLDQVETASGKCHHDAVTPGGKRPAGYWVRQVVNEILFEQRLLVMMQRKHALRLPPR